MERRRDFAYLTEGVRLITENTAKFAGGNYLTERWIDQFTPPEPEDTRTGMEIAVDRLEQLGIRVVE